MIYTSSKRIELGSTAFRQPSADSHCKFIHGYQLNAELTFGCSELDKNNWVYDFGGLKQLKTIFNNQFDHTLVISASDIHKDKFVALNEVGAADVRIMEGGVGIEKFAEWVYKTADTYIDETTEGRVWVESATVFEHGNNFASVKRPITETNLYKDEEGTVTYVTHEELNERWEKSWKEWQQTQEKASQVEPEVEETHTPKGAKVGPNKTTGNFSDPFAGTSWGNS
jgi:6-pyruvoyltetrahydropterin/6-carboxytetrahydropterin synthase